MTREFRNKKGNKVWIWKISQDGESYHTEHGLQDGKMQTFSDRPGDKGKPDTKAYVNALDNCKFHVSREIRKKEEHGYIEYVDGKPVKETVTEISPDKFLPKNFCSYKPQTSIKDTTLQRLHKENRAKYTRKYDGMCHVAMHHTSGWEIYSRRMDLVSERFPNHIKQLEETDFGVGTLLQGELICSRNDGTDDFRSISRVCRSDPPEARKLIESGEVPEPVFLIFDVIYHNGQDLSNTKYGDRSQLWSKFHEYAGAKIGDNLIYSVEYCNVTPDTWQAVAKEKGWEGFVVTDIESIPKDKFFSFDGDAKRPKGHHKLKPEFTDECVVYAATAGTGKRMGKIGAIFVKQIHPETKKWFDCGKVGSGFTDIDIENFMDLCDMHSIPILKKDTEAKSIKLDNSKEDVVVEIKYSERQEDTNKFRFPVFLRVRDDKAANECIAQQVKD